MSACEGAFFFGSSLISEELDAFTVVDLAATPRTAGPLRDGYGVRRARFAVATGFPALAGLAALRKTTHLRSAPVQTRFASQITYARLARALRTLCKPCWVAGSPTAGAWALFAPQPAHTQLC